MPPNSVDNSNNNNYIYQTELCCQVHKLATEMEEPRIFSM